MTIKEYRKKVTAMKKIIKFLHKENLITAAEKDIGIQKLDALGNKQILELNVSLNLQIKFEHY